MFSPDIQTPRGGFKNNGAAAEFSNTNVLDIRWNSMSRVWNSFSNHPLWIWYSLYLVIIIDYGSVFVLLSCLLESKGVQFTSASDKINRGGLSTVALDTLKIFAFVPQEHQTRMRSDKHDYWTNNGVTRVNEAHKTQIHVHTWNVVDSRWVMPI